MPAKKKAEKKHVINFGKFNEHLQIGGEIKKLHELTETEKKFLIEDFKKLKKLEKEENAELKAIKHFEKKLQELTSNLVYLEGYIQQIEDGNSMLKINPSVKVLGNKLVENIDEVEQLSSSILNEEKKIIGLARHVDQVLNKAKKYQRLIFS